MFGDLTKEKICKLSLLMSEVEFESARTIIKQGEAITQCYVIMSGKVRVLITSLLWKYFRLISNH